MTHQYDPKSVIMTLGAIPISGLADGTFVTVENNEDAFALQIGADGEGTRSRTNNDSAKITLTLTQASASNDALSALHELDKAFPGGAGVVPFFLRDLLGTASFFAQSAWISKRPKAEFGIDAGTREWVIETDKLVPFDGGSLT